MATRHVVEPEEGWYVLAGQTRQSEAGLTSWSYVPAEQLNGSHDPEEPWGTNVPAQGQDMQFRRVDMPDPQGTQGVEESES